MENCKLAGDFQAEMSCNVILSGTPSPLSRPLVLHSRALTARLPVNNNDDNVPTCDVFAKLFIVEIFILLNKIS